MSAGFTPGPWAITSISQDTGAIGIAKDRVMIAEAHNGYSFMDVVQHREPKTQFANARLIAVAPELYALLVVLEWGDDERPGCPFCGMGKETGHLERCQLADALAKVRGEQS